MPTKPTTAIYNSAAIPVRPDRVVGHYPYDDGSGAVLRNLGRTHNSIFGGADGAYVGAAVFDDDAEGPYVDGGVGIYDTLLTNSSGAALTMPRGTILFRCQPVFDGAARPILMSSNIQGTTGCVFLRHTATAGTLVAGINDAATAKTYTDTGVSSAEITFVLRWGTGFFAWRDGVAMGTPANNPSTSTAALIIPDTAVFYIGRNSAAADGSLTKKRVLTIWDVELTDYEISHLWADPYLVSRNWPDAYFEDWVGPIASRITSTTVLFRMMARFDLSGTARFRMKTATSVLGLLSAVPTSAQTTATQNAHLDIPVTSLTANTRYYYQGEWSPDGSAWFPFPGGHGSFTTKEA